MIQFNDTFSAKKYQYGWELQEKQVGTRKGSDDPGAKFDKYYVTYWPTLKLLCKSLLDKSIGECESVAQVDEKMDEVLRQIEAAVARVEG